MFHLVRFPYSILHFLALEDCPVNNEACALPTDSQVPAVTKSCFLLAENSAWTLGWGNPEIWFTVLHNSGQAGWCRERDCTGGKNGRVVSLKMESERQQLPWVITLCPMGQRR